ncbi:hypothetical protein A2617_01455 [Candidatus Daviesbacteria bacterium RIFOXYD1_FULL_41_10]|uniref:Cyclic nucleotide-binding protein n=2 Tax=Candidatus Daviesiibacteriota TaxID=1752718 RepID=A0A1F5N0G8_9BACT|nr:MAG: hypothetical protein UU67_C0031G0021 [Candidatus Daviesbacteria bacterium GW2011_GWB1_41_5]OGE70980.1 MAG: hypothetical protein A2617_01455 [Candidatus Daviesbacteria bacterium RIFOXYD1_FULL_41_10]
MSDKLVDYLNLRHKPENINIKHRQSIGFQERVALWTTRLIGTMWAVYFAIFIMALWMLWQSSSDLPFDPYPFAFLLFIASALQLPLMSLIMVGQNLLGRHTEMRAEEEFKTTESIYKDIEKIFIHLDEQDKKLEQVITLLGRVQKK